MDINQQNEDLAAERVRIMREIAAQIRSGVTEKVVMGEVRQLQSEIQFDRAFLGLGAHAVDEALCLDDWLTAHGEGETLSREDQETIKDLVDRSIKQTATYVTIGRNAARAIFQQGQDLDDLVKTIEHQCPPRSKNMRDVIMKDSQPSRLKMVSEALHAFRPSMQKAWQGADVSRKDDALQSYIDILKAFGYTVTHPNGSIV